MSKQDDQVEDALSAIRLEYQRIVGPRSIKAFLVKETKTNARVPGSASPLWLRPITLGSALLVVCCIGSTYFYLGHRGTKQEPAISLVAVPQPTVDRASEYPSTQSPFTQSSDTSAHGRRVTAPPALSRKDSAGEFITLPSSEGLPAPTVATLVRMRIRRDDLREFGLDVPPTAAPEMVLAEFVVGEDGLSRAVRFVR